MTFEELDVLFGALNDFDQQINPKVRSALQAVMHELELHLSEAWEQQELDERRRERDADETRGDAKRDEDR